MEKEIRKQIVDKVLAVFCNVHSNRPCEAKNVMHITHVSFVKEAVEDCMEITEEEIAEYLHTHGYDVGYNEQTGWIGWITYSGNSVED